MNGAEIKQLIATNLNQWDQDANAGAGAWIEGKVTEQKADNYMNFLYREDIFPFLSDKFPRDFMQTTEPFDLWTATGTVHASSSGTTLVATTSIFTNDMAGKEVINQDTGQKIKIASFTSATTVTLEEEPDESWSGDVIYVLGNEYGISKDPSEAGDVKEIHEFWVRYDSSLETEFIPAEQRNPYHVRRNGYSYNSPSSPFFYDTMLTVDDVSIKGVGLIPAPTGYQGQGYITYTAKPVVIEDDTEPTLQVVGLGLILADGVTSWALGIKGEDQKDIDLYQNKYKEGKANILLNYKPKNRLRPARSRAGGYVQAISSRSI